MALIKNKFTYKGQNIKYKVEAYCNTIFDTKTYEIIVYYKYGGFFGESDHITLDKAWSAKENSVENFIERWENKSKEDLDKIAREVIKEEIDEKLKSEEMHSKISKIFD